MQLVELVQEVLTTGELTTNRERQVQSFLKLDRLDETEIDAIERLLDAITQGAIRSVPNPARR